MRVYHYHPETSVFTGTTDANPSPLERGVFLLPANATFVAPPECPEGFYLVFGDYEWMLMEIPKPEEAPEPEPEV